MHRQLDIFDDGRDTVLRNDLAQALLDGDVDRAERAASALATEFGTDPVLAPAAELIDHLRWRRHAGVAIDAARVLEARLRLGGRIAAAASSALGPRHAAGWLAGQWCWLADSAAHIGWSPAQADAHPAALYLRGQAWQKAAEAVAGIASWRRIPVPLLWMAHARWRTDGADAAWPLLAEALWLAPARAAALLPALADRDLGRLAARFEEHFDRAAEPGREWAWLPAFALVDRPQLAGPLAPAAPPADSPPGQAFQAMQALLRLERQGRHHEIVAHRARLKSLSAPLFAAYMSTR